MNNINIRMIELALQDLNNANAGITASALISTDGLPVATALQHGTEPDRVGGMSAALLALGNRATRELQCGTMSQVMVQGDDGYIVLVQANHDNVLVLTAKEDAKLGLILLNARNTVKNLAEWLGDEHVIL